MRALIFCTTCRHSPEAKTGPDGLTGGERLKAEAEAALARAGRTDMRVEGQACLWNCKRHCSVVFRDDARFSYVGGDYKPEAEAAEAIIAWFDLHGKSETGEVSFKEWPDGVRGHFIARMPPLKGDAS